ncbi:MAG: CBS domain-containing protein, partial [Pseudomonadota bacterium]|nr:CBS domain-containing protein [Pseudomonadota bacterium]
MNVKMILGDKGTDVLTIDSSNKLSDAIAVLENRSVGILVTTSPEEPMAGVISERDVVRALSNHGAPALERPISD